MLNDHDIDALIDSVSKELENSEALAKSKDKAEKKEMKKDEPAPKPEDKPSEAAPAAPPADAPAMAPEAEAPAAEAPAPEEQAPEAPAEDMAAEAEGDVSDEDLMQIYSSMAPEELERHVMIAQEVLSQMQGGQPGAQPGAAPAPSQEQAPEAMALSEKDAAGKALAKAEEAKDKEIADLKGQIGDLKKSVELITKAVETGFRPVRKSVAGVEFTTRGEGEGDAKPLSKSELDAKVKEKVKDPKLTKAERQLINDYCLNGKSKAEVEKLVSGGK